MSLGVPTCMQKFISHDYWSDSVSEEEGNYLCHSHMMPLKWFRNTWMHLVKPWL